MGASRAESNTVSVGPMVVDKDKYFELIKYKPHPKQWLYHRSPKRFRVACCGRRFGKSTMAARDLEPELLVPNRRYWIVGPTYDLAEKEFRVVWMDMIVGLKMGRDKRVRKAYNKRSGEMYIEFPWHTRLECRSAKHPETLVGEKLHGAIMSEAAKHSRETWEQYVRAALSDERGWATFPTTPEGFNWLYDLWMLSMQPSKFPDYEAWRFPSWENRVIFKGGRQDSEILQVEGTTAVEWFLQEYGAEFGSFMGKIYSEFDPFLHIKEHKFNPDWPNYVAFDFGFANPFVALEFQVDPWDRVYVWREYVKPYTTLEQHIYNLKNRQNPEGYHLDCGFGDAADPGSAVTLSTHYVGTWALPEAKGPGEAIWRQGVNLVKKFLQPRDVYTPDGGLVVVDEYGTPKQEPWLFVDPKCTQTIKEFNNYRIADHKPEVSPREAAKNFEHDCMDALRYALMHVFELGCTAHLSDVYSVSDFTTDAGTGDFHPDTDSGYFTMNQEF